MFGGEERQLRVVRDGAASAVRICLELLNAFRAVVRANLRQRQKLNGSTKCIPERASQQAAVEHEMAARCPAVSALSPNSRGVSEIQVPLATSPQVAPHRSMASRWATVCGEPVENRSATGDARGLRESLAWWQVA